MFLITVSIILALNSTEKYEKLTNGSQCVVDRYEICDINMDNPQNDNNCYIFEKYYDFSNYYLDSANEYFDEIYKVEDDLYESYECDHILNTD